MITRSVCSSVFVDRGRSWLKAMYSPSQALGTHIVTNLHSFQVASQISRVSHRRSLTSKIARCWSYARKISFSTVASLRRSLYIVLLVHPASQNTVRPGTGRRKRLLSLGLQSAKWVNSSSPR